MSDDAPAVAAVSHDDNPGGVSIEQLVAELPAPVAELGAGAHWDVVRVAPTGATVWRLRRADGSLVYLKVAPGAGGAAEALRVEAGRLGWLAGVLAGNDLDVPTVLASVTDEASGEHYLAMTALAGEPADRSGARGDAESLLALLAGALRTLHDRPVPSADGAVSSVDDLLARAGERVRSGAVDRSRFQPIHARYTPEQLYEHLLVLRPTSGEDPVVVHGDPALDNTIIDGGRVAGYVGVGRARVADRYLDLAIVARELARHVSPHALGPFFSAYGIDAPDVRKVDFYLMLDEFS
jgi:aminoglycoside 3'-phosphotransferase-1